MNRSDLFNWLLANDCPFYWETDDYWDDPDSVKLRFKVENHSLVMEED